MDKPKEYRLTPDDIRAIESVLNLERDNRVEVVPVRDGGIRVLRVRRDTISNRTS